MSEEQQQSMEMEKMLCGRCHSFFGSPATNYLCSKCWKASVGAQSMDLDSKVDSKKQSASLVSAPETATHLPPPPPPPSALPSPSVSVSPTPPSTSTPTTPLRPAIALVSSKLGAGDGNVASADVGGASEAGIQHLKRPIGEEDVGSGAAAAASSSAAEGEDVATPPGSQQKNRKRCFTCNKKVGYTGIECKCRLMFCAIHRYPDQHGCTFDFKTDDRKNLERLVTGGGTFSKVDRL